MQNKSEELKKLNEVLQDLPLFALKKIRKKIVKKRKKILDEFEKKV